MKNYIFDMYMAKDNSGNDRELQKLLNVDTYMRCVVEGWYD